MSDVPQVTIYSAPWCAFCHTAKAYLDSKKVIYTDINVDKDQNAARELVEKTGQAGIPVIYIGDEMILGFDRPRIDSALSAAKLI
jgi:glutaredoxin 3